MKLPKFKNLLLFVFLFLLLSFSCCMGSEKVGVAVEQSVFSFSLWPGQKQEFIINSKNIISSRQKMSFEVIDFFVGENNETAFLSDGNEIYGMKNWVSNDKKDWIAETGDQDRNKFVIDVPEDASVGSHYCVIMLSALPIVDGENFQKPLVGGQIGVYVLVNVLGDVSGKGKIEDFQVPKIAQKENALNVVFKNEGNVHYVPHGGIEVKNIFTGKTEDEKLEKHFVFPGKNFSFQHNWATPSLFGAYSVKAYFVDQDGRNLFKEKLVFGKYFPFVSVLLAGGIFLFWKFRKKIKILEKINRK